MDDLKQANIRPVARWAGITVAGLVSCRLALLVVPHVLVGLAVGLAINGGMVAYLVRGVRACTRGELESMPLFKPATPSGKGPNVRVHTYARTRVHAHAREEA